MSPAKALQLFFTFSRYQRFSASFCLDHHFRIAHPVKGPTPLTTGISINLVKYGISAPVNIPRASHVVAVREVVNVKNYLRDETVRNVCENPFLIPKNTST
jgi:hypothetical protein